MKKNTIQLLLSSILLFYSNYNFSQNIIDNCLTSVTPVSGSDFISSSNIANIYSSDVLNWNGSSWFGGYTWANITIPPPTNQIGCRAIFLGNGTTWTGGGEQIGLKLSSPLVSGTTYTFSITYVSHGNGSNGNFSPSFYTNSSASMGGSSFVNSLPSVGYNWTTNDFTFTASSTQNGHTWIILKTEQNDSSGLINSFCQNCNTSGCSVSVNNATICQGATTNITATPNITGNYSYQWTVPSGFSNPGNVSSFTTNVGGNYSVNITNLDNNCTANASGSVTVNPLPVVTVNNVTICQGATTNIAANPSTAGNYSYQWTVPAGVTNPGNVSNFTTNVAGNYSVIITNLTTNCVSNMATGTVSYFPEIEFSINQNCSENEFVLEIEPINDSFNVDNSTIVWQLNNTINIGYDNILDLSAYINSTSIIENLPFNISATITTNEGCQKTGSLIIDHLFCGIQKGISPNNDGSNDFFDLISLDVRKLEIFNRYGVKVFEKHNYTNEWSGQSNNGNELPNGVYYYLIEFKNNSASKTGWIYLLRNSN